MNFLIALNIYGLCVIDDYSDHECAKFIGADDIKLTGKPLVDLYTGDDIYFK